MHKIRRVVSVLAVFLAGLPVVAGGQPAEAEMSPLDLRGGSSALCPTPDQLSPDRPDTEGPTDVGVALFLNDIVALDDATQSVTADVYLLLRWTDPWLADSERGASQAICELPFDQVWSPVVQTRGLRQLERLYQDVVAIDAAGTLTRAQRFNVELAVPLDLRDFPFDRHTLEFTIETVFSSVAEVRFLALDELSGMADRVSLTGWSLGVPTVAVETAHASRLQIDRPVFHLSVEARREAQFYVLKAIGPLTLIVFMSWAVFWIDPQQIARVGLSATAILTLIAYQFAFADLLPRISYLTRADRFTVGSLLLVFFALLEVVMTSALAKQGRSETGDRIDRVSRVTFPVALAGIIAASFLI